MENIGLVGAGVMGLTVAKKLIDAGLILTVCDLSPEAVDKAVALGARSGYSPAKIGEKAEIVLLFLPGPDEVMECVNGTGGLLSTLKAESVIVDLGTTDPGTSEKMAIVAAGKDIGYLDAPVLGRPITVGQWALPVGGTKEALERCKPILSVFASNIFHVGPTGSGNKIKLLNQLMFGAINAMTAEMMAIAEKIGIPPRQLYEIIKASNAGTISNLFKELGQRVAEDTYEKPTFTVDLLVKDIKLAVQMAKIQNAPPILARSVELINEMSQAQGLGAEDTSIMWKSYRNIWERN